MDARRDAPSAADLAAEANGLGVGLGMISMIYVPFALPCLLLLLPLALPLIPLLLLGGLGYLLARMLRRARRAFRRRAGAPQPGVESAHGRRSVAGASASEA